MAAGVTIEHISGQEHYFRKMAVEFLKLSLSPSHSLEEGELGWSADEGTAQIAMPGGEVFAQLFMEMFLPRRVKNNTGGELTNGQYVYISGGSGTNAYIELANADSNATGIKTIAMLTESIPDGQFGYATVFGIVRGTEDEPIDTSSWAPGTQLYLASTDGEFTDTMPVHPNLCIRSGYVFRQHATKGWIFVKI